MSTFRRLSQRLRASGRSSRERGQTLVLFVIVAVVLIGSVAIVTDVSWLWVNQQRMQRAADAAALAGAIYLPDSAYPIACALDPLAYDGASWEAFCDTLAVTYGPPAPQVADIAQAYACNHYYWDTFTDLDEGSQGHAHA